MDLHKIIEQVRLLAVQAGEKILEYYEAGTAVEYKENNTPVTAADQAAEDIITAGLNKITPDIPVVAEEACEAGRIPTNLDGYVWYVDPLDGTKEFVKGTGEFSVNIGLVHEGRPIAGVIYMPYLKEMFAAVLPDYVVMNKGGEDIPIKTREADPENIVMVVSRHYDKPGITSRLLEEQGLKIVDRIHYGSAYKLCKIAAGEADIYPRRGPTCEWDTAAGEAILMAAGGKILTLEWKPLTYGNRDVKFSNPFFVALGAGNLEVPLAKAYEEADW